jgi:hypothetical protein
MAKREGVGFAIVERADGHYAVMDAHGGRAREALGFKRAEKGPFADRALAMAECESMARALHERWPGRFGPVQDLRS